MAISIAACGSGVDLPLISPPVRAATPAALQSATRMRPLDATLSAGDIHDRFFSGSGPTDLMTLLGSVDDRLAEINSSGASSCLDAPPVDVVYTPVGGSVTLPAQCYRTFDSPSPGPSFMQFAVVGGTTSIYVAIAEVRLAAVITPVAATADYDVDAWFGVGYTNATTCGGSFDGCSYGLTELHASSASHAFEMSVAGIGEGYCGVQLVSDGTSIYGIGSTDMGETCDVAGDLCVDAADLTMPGSCASPTMTLPALGRLGGAGAHVFGASMYPDVPDVTLDGTDTDSLHFGPEAPSEGVASFD